MLRDDGTLWLNLGDSYAGIPQNRSDEYLTRTGGNSGLNSRNARTHERTKLASLKPKDLVGIPWRVAFALQADGWWLRSDIIWAKSNPMPESVTDRPTKAHEYLFLLAKSANYYYDQDAIRENFTDDRMGNPGTNGIRKYAPGDRQDVGRPMAWTRGAGFIVGSSPEVLVRLEKGRVEVRPIAGTRHRGTDEKQDLLLEKRFKK